MSENKIGHYLVNREKVSYYDVSQIIEPKKILEHIQSHHSTDDMYSISKMLFGINPHRINNTLNQQLIEAVRNATFLIALKLSLNRQQERDAGILKTAFRTATINTAHSISIFFAKKLPVKTQQCIEETSKENDRPGSSKK